MPLVTVVYLASGGLGAIVGRGRGEPGGGGAPFREGAGAARDFIVRVVGVVREEPEGFGGRHRERSLLVPGTGARPFAGHKLLVEGYPLALGPGEGGEEVHGGGFLRGRGHAELRPVELGGGGALGAGPRL